MASREMLSLMDIAVSKQQYVKNAIDLDQYTLVAGVGNRAARDLCIMSLAAVMAGEAHGDSVACACPVVRAFAIRLNDRMGAVDRQRLKPIALEILGTKGSRELEQRRMYRCADWAVREVAAGAMDAIGLVENAIALRGLGQIIDKESAEMARIFARAAYVAAYAAAAANAAAAYAAANAAAASTAAYNAAYNAYRAAAAYAAEDAAYAAEDAAEDAAYAADARKDARSAADDRSIAFLRELCEMSEVA